MFSRLPDKPKLSLKQRHGIGGIGGGFSFRHARGKLKEIRSTAPPHVFRYGIANVTRTKPPILETEFYRELGQMRLSFLFNFLPKWTLHFVTCKFMLIQLECMGHRTVSTLSAHSQHSQHTVSTVSTVSTLSASQHTVSTVSTLSAHRQHTVSTLHCFATLKNYVIIPSNTNSSQYLFLLTL